MSADDWRESDDSLDDQDETDVQIRRDDQEDIELDELDDLEEEVDNQVNDVKEVKSSNNKNRQENRTDASSSKSPKQSRIASRSETPQNQSRTLNHPQINRSWRSANAFINFVQDFKQDCPDITGRNIFQICGERWKCMTDEQKQPYIAAANTVKRLKQRKIGDNNDQQTKKSVTRVSKRKAETKRKETSQKRFKANKREAKSNSDTDTATTTVHSSMSDPDSS